MIETMLTWMILSVTGLAIVYVAGLLIQHIENRGRKDHR